MITRLKVWPSSRSRKTSPSLHRIHALDSGRAWHRSWSCPDARFCNVCKPVSRLNRCRAERLRNRPTRPAGRAGDRHYRPGQRTLLRPLQSHSFDGRCKIRTCLFSVVEHDLRRCCRRGGGQVIRDFLLEVAWQKSPPSYWRGDFIQPPDMSCIGG